MVPMVYNIIAYPNGKREVVATLHGLRRNGEYMVEIAAMRAGVPTGSELDGIVKHAEVQAKVRGEYVDVERPREGMSTGQLIATVGAEGVI